MCSSYAGAGGVGDCCAPGTEVANCTNGGVAVRTKWKCVHDQPGLFVCCDPSTSPMPADYSIHTDRTPQVGCSLLCDCDGAKCDMDEIGSTNQAGTLIMFVGHIFWLFMAAAGLVGACTFAVRAPAVPRPPTANLPPPLFTRPLLPPPRPLHDFA